MQNGRFSTPFMALLFALGAAQMAMAQVPNFPWCVAHRGYSSEYLENSYAAIQAAIALGADAIELDVRHSRDGFAIVHHDGQLKRTAKSKPNKKCKLHKPIGMQDFTVMNESCQLKNNEQLLLLESVLKAFMGLDQALIIEFKDFPSSKTLQLLQRYQQESLNIIAVSFEQKVLDTLADLSLIYQSPMLLIWLTPVSIYLPERFDGIGPFLISDEMISYLSNNDKLIDVWTVDRKNKIKSLFSKGVQMVTTNQLESCLQVKTQLRKPSFEIRP